MNKRGFIRTIEALIAIVLLLGLIVFIYSGNPKKLPSTPEVVDKASSFIINEFLNKPEFRNCFVSISQEGRCNEKLNPNCKISIENFITKSIPLGYNYDCEVCFKAKSCLLSINAAKDI